MEAQRILAVLPAGKHFDQLYAGVLLPWAEARGARLERLDPAARSIGALAPALEGADWLLAEISGAHPRVMHLAGYAQGIGKRVIFLAQFDDEFPFDQGQQTVIVHSGNADFLRKELERLNARGEAEGEGKSGGDAREKFLALFGEIMRKHGHEHRGSYEMEGAGTFILRDQDLDLPLVQELSRRARELGMRIKLM